MEAYNFVSFAGVFILLFVAWLLSSDRKVLNWRLIFRGVLLQMVFALFVFILPQGRTVFLWINDGVVKLLQAASAGSEFVFGRLALQPGTTNESGESSLGFILAFQALPTIIFFSALMSILYYTGVMQRIIKTFARIFTVFMNLSGAESLCAGSNIFVGVESALTVKPYLGKMTRSELCTVLTAGMATVASNVLAVYVFFLQDGFPSIAGHLVSASIISAPAALVMSKLIYPETGEPVTLGKSVEPHYERESSFFEAIIKGADAGLKLILGIVALLIAVLGLVALLDMILGGAGGLVNDWLGWNMDWTLTGLLGYLFYPVALVLGVPAADAFEIGRIIGERAVVTELVSYRELGMLIESGALRHPRSAFICTYALCGFAHVASLAIFVGGVSALAPKRTADLAAVGFRALAAATLACLMTACIAGTFYTGGSILLR